jgi:hypothetical protein
MPNKIIRYKKCKTCNQKTPISAIVNGACLLCINAYNTYIKPVEEKRKAKEAQKHKQRLKKYGLTDESFKELMINQQGRCAICKKIKHRLVIDHCHKCGKTRKLLCNSCNTGLGLLGDSAKIIRRALQYVRDHRKVCDTSGTKGTKISTKN